MDKVNDKNNERKSNNRKRPFYFIFYILILVFLTIAYASLAVNFGVKINVPTIIEPDNPDTSIPEKPTPKPEIVNYEPDPDPEPIPVIIPDTVEWKLLFENVEVKDGSIDAITDANISTSKTTINYEIRLKEPGEFYEFEVDIVNKGNVDAKLYDIIEKTITSEQRKFLDYEITYNDGTSINIGDFLKAGTRKTIRVYIKFKDDDIEASDLPDSAQDLKLSYQMIYVEK